MLILNMLLRITGLTQEQLSNEVGISRASINSWLSDDSSMSFNSKQKIATRFQFPVSFFDYDLDLDINAYKLIYDTINERWKTEKKFSNARVDKVNEIINSIESSVPNEYYSTADIMEGLINGFNPFTGEVFEDGHILYDQRIRHTLEKLYGHQKFGVNNITKEDLDYDERELFEKLRRWRLDKRDEEGYYNAYIVFTDRELINIIKADVQCKEDLKNIKGIGFTKYEKYADELFDIISKWRESTEESVDDDFSFLESVI